MDRCHLLEDYLREVSQIYSRRFIPEVNVETLNKFEAGTVINAEC